VPAIAYPLVVNRQTNNEKASTMARSAEIAGVDAAMELIMQEGFEGLGEAVRTLINEAMRIERYTTTASKLAQWAETALPEGLAVLGFPEPHRRRPRTRDATLFPNED